MALDMFTKHHEKGRYKKFGARLRFFAVPTRFFMCQHQILLPVNPFVEYLIFSLNHDVFKTIHISTHVYKIH